MRQDNNIVAVEKEDFRSWMTTRMQELKRDHPLRSKKDRWRMAQSEWLELRRRWMRKQGEEKGDVRTGRTTPFRPMPFGR
jgi:hypothetical protein